MRRGPGLQQHPRPMMWPDERLGQIRRSRRRCGELTQAAATAVHPAKMAAPRPARPGVVGFRPLLQSIAPWASHPPAHPAKKRSSTARVQILDRRQTFRPAAENENGFDAASDAHRNDGERVGTGQRIFSAAYSIRFWCLGLGSAASVASTHFRDLDEAATDHGGRQW